jgi:hypothetical protein
LAQSPHSILGPRQLIGRLKDEEEEEEEGIIPGLFVGFHTLTKFVQ